MITIIGSGGFVGKALVKYFLDQGRDLYLPLKDDNNFINKDLGVVIYCAGLTADWVKRPFDMIEAHVSFLAKILKGQNFSKLIYLSSTRLYDSLSISDQSAIESSSLSFNTHNQRHLYDLSKALGESLCNYVAPKKTIVARLASVYSCEEFGEGFLSQLLNDLKHNMVMTVDSSPNIKRDYICIEDVCKAFDKLLESNNSGTYNIASGVNFSNQDIVNIFNKYGRSLILTGPITNDNTPVIDIRKLNDLGVFPIKPREYLKNYLSLQDEIN